MTRIDYMDDDGFGLSSADGGKMVICEYVFRAYQVSCYMDSLDGPRLERLEKYDGLKEALVAGCNFIAEAVAVPAEALAGRN